MVDEELSPEEKARIAASLLLSAPPCEFNEVFNDVRILVNDDNVLREKVAGTFAQYNKDQLTPCKVDGGQTLITEYSDLGNGRFLDPRSKQSFRFDHLKHEASDLQAVDVDQSVEQWRSSFEEKLDHYVNEHYRNSACCVFGAKEDGNIRINACIESHYAKNQATGRWRSDWSITFPHNPNGASAVVKGIVKTQSHLFEDGNVQLISSKEVNETIPANNERQLAEDVIKLMRERDDDYQRAVGENFKNLSEKTFKALRRRLPLTRSKIDWSKIISYKIGSELPRNA